MCAQPGLSPSTMQGCVEILKAAHGGKTGSKAGHTLHALAPLGALKDTDKGNAHPELTSRTTNRYNGYSILKPSSRAYLVHVRKDSNGVIKLERTAELKCKRLAVASASDNTRRIRETLENITNRIRASTQ